MKKRFFEYYLLRLYYNTKVINKTGFNIDFEFLYDDELEFLYKSFGFSIFKFRYKIGVFIENVCNALKK